MQYEYKSVKLFALATLFWAVIGMGIGVFIAFQMFFPALNFETPWITFGRLRPCHTTGVIFAFAGNALLATSLYIVQRTSGARIYAPKLVMCLFYAFQFFVILSMVGYTQGITQGKEYAEPEWYADILLTVIWVCYLFIFLATLKRRKEPHIYVANWFFIAFIIVVAVLHVGNNISIPISFMSNFSVSVFSGVQSAMIQWWYGHNAVGFWLTAGFIGIMYYFVPKRANRPIYSYRLSILHFWALIFIYIWAGPHHLIYTSLPDWVQSLGMTMSIILWLPSWGGMVNGIMTISSAWDKLKKDPVLKFLFFAVIFYGLSTFEGPLMAIKSVNAISHYTEWTVSHVHSGALGWVALISFGALYHMIPVLWAKDGMYSTKLISLHLWLALVGIMLYIISMWVAGVTQGLMWRAHDDMGFLKYSFIEIVKIVKPLYLARAIGGFLFWLGAVVMVFNTYMTIKTKTLK